MTIALAPVASRARALGLRHIAASLSPAGVYGVKESWRSFIAVTCGRYAGLVTVRTGTIAVLPALVVTSELGTSELGGTAKWTTSSYPLRSLFRWISIACAPSAARRC